MLLQEQGGGTPRAMVAAGTAHIRKQGVEHIAVNDGTAPVSFVEVEPKWFALAAPAHQGTRHRTSSVRGIYAGAPVTYLCRATDRGVRRR